jgi:hypothetical protein
MSTLVINVVSNTPWWAFAVLALLLALGVQALRPRIIPLWRLLVTPGIFIAWGLVSLVLRLGPGSSLYLLDWLVAAGVGAALSWITTRPTAMRIDPGGVAMPGSIVPLIRNLLIFSAKYALTAAAAFDPAHRQDLAFWDIAVSGASAGYFIGWLAHLARLYRRGPRGELVVPGQ